LDDRAWGMGGGFGCTHTYSLIRLEEESLSCATLRLYTVN